MKQLKDDFKKGQFKKVYLLFGEERYLVKHYERDFTNKLMPDGNDMMNRDVFDGPDIPADKIMDAANTLPFLNDTRLVYVRGSNLFVPGRKADSDDMTDYLSTLPDSTILIFVETAVDKRSRLYKKAAETGRAVEFTTPSERELIQWVGNVFKKKGKIISNENAVLLLGTVTRGMDAIYAEADKLGDYVGERNEIMAEDIKAVCSKSLETRIFDLVAAVGSGQAEKALEMYNNMLLLKEQPIMILTMMARQFRLILQCKACSEKKMTPGDMASTLNLRSFIVSECLKQSRHFTVERLLDALRDCQDIDTRIKTGRIADKTGVETLIVRYTANNRSVSGDIQK